MSEQSFSMSMMIAARRVGTERNVAQRDNVLCEYGAEIVWIYAGIVASSLFRIDVPSSH